MPRVEIVTLLFNLSPSQWKKYIFATGLLSVLLIIDCEKSYAYANSSRINELSAKQKENKAKPENLYQANQYGEAIEIWLEKLNIIQDPEQRSVIHNNLAIAYQKIDKTAESICQWQQAINYYESLTPLAKSQNRQRLGNECSEPKSHTQSAQDLRQSKSALVYSIILPQKIYLVAKFPDESLRIYQLTLSKRELGTKIKRLRFTLENVATDEYLIPAKEMYDLLIVPMEKDLRRSQVKQLVFVNDGIFQTIPMAALHDGKQFLIQKYPIIYLTSSQSNNFQNRNLSLETSSPKSSKLSLVSFGLSEAISPFIALPNVVEELNQIKEIWKQKSLSDLPTGVEKSFLNQKFTLETLQSQIKSGYDVVHLATHAKFDATPESTFLQAFDQKINLNQFESILRSSKSQIELLVLSACQTATGDSLATLGLAGVALRSGVKNVLATLWAVDDTDVVPLIKEFYQAWQIEGLSKAQALQKSQIKGITENNLHPSSWSAFILVAN